MSLLFLIADNKDLFFKKGIENKIMNVKMFI